MMRRGNGRAGSSMIEFALVFLVVLVMLTGAIECGRAIWSYTTVAHAAREGARFAMVRGGANPVSQAAVESFVEGRAPGLDPGALTATLTWIPDASEGTMVDLRVNYRFDFVAARLLFLPGSINMAANTRMTVLR